MPIYRYKATDPSGKTTSGTVDAKSKELAASLLKNQGYYVINIGENRESFVNTLLSVRGVSSNELVTFTRQMSAMISAGLPVSQGIEVIADQTVNISMRKVLFDILRDVEGGSSLSAAFGRFPTLFPPVYQALVRSGESSGRLDEVMSRLAETMEAERELTSKIKAAMIYPTIVILAMIGVFILMMVFVIPKLAEMYRSLNVELPMVTQIMISISDFFVKYIYLVIFGIVAVILGFKAFLRSEDGQALVSEISFVLPVFGIINRQKDLAQFTRIMSLLIGAAIPMVEALYIVSKVVSNTAYKLSCVQAAKRIEKGGTLSEYFKLNKAIFPPIIGQMAVVGEETGQLEMSFSKLADYFDGEVSHAVRGLSAALEPIILILLGGMVGILIISIIVPIYKITSAL